MAAPLVTFQVDLPGSRGEIRLSGPLVNHWSEDDRLVGYLTGSTVATEFALSLRRFIDLANEANDWRNAGTALHHLLNEGQVYWDRVILRSARPRFGDLLKQLEAASGLGKHGVFPLIAIRTSQYKILPLELLPLGTYSRLAPASTKDDVLRIARFLIGFSCVVEYIIVEPVGKSIHEEVRRSRLPAETIRILRSVRTPMWATVLRYLVEATIRHDGPYPSAGAFEDATSILTSMMVPDQSSGDVPAGVVYVHAHGRADSKGGLGGGFRFEFHYGTSGLLRRSPSPVVVTYADIVRVANRDSPVTASDSARCGPVVLLNSCFSGGALGNELVSAALRIQEGGAAIVIAPRDETPEGDASTFARLLLPSLMESGSVGAAVVVARNKLLRSRKTPVGCIYATYGVAS